MKPSRFAPVAGTGGVVCAQVVDNFWRSLPTYIILRVRAEMCLYMFLPLHGTDLTPQVDVLLPKNATA